MSKPALSPPRSFHSLLAIVVAALLGLLAIAALKSYRDLETARDRQRELERRIETTRERNEELRRSVERLAADPAALERLAREELGMVRPGDVVILLPEEETPPRSVAEPAVERAAAPPAL